MYNIKLDFRILGYKGAWIEEVTDTIGWKRMVIAPLGFRVQGGQWKSTWVIRVDVWCSWHTLIVNLHQEKNKNKTLNNDSWAILSRMRGSNTEYKVSACGIPHIHFLDIVIGLCRWHCHSDCHQILLKTYILWYRYSSIAFLFAPEEQSRVL